MTGSQTSSTTIPGATGNEAQLLQLLTQIARRSSGQMGDLSQLAKGQMGGPSEQDYQLVQDTMGRSSEMAQRELQRSMGPLMAQIGERMGARGTKGSSIEMLENALMGREMQGNMADLLAQSQNQGAEALMNLPFRRGEMQIGANQALFNMLTGSASPVLQNMLAGRLAQQKTTTETKPGLMDIFSMASGIGGLPMFSNLFQKKTETK